MNGFVLFNRTDHVAEHQDVPFLDGVIILGILKQERDNAIIDHVLEPDPRIAFGDYCHLPEVPRCNGSVLTTRPLGIILSSYDHMTAECIFCMQGKVIKV